MSMNKHKKPRYQCPKCLDWYTIEEYYDKAHKNWNCLICKVEIKNSKMWKRVSIDSATKALAEIFSV